MTIETLNNVAEMSRGELIDAAPAVLAVKDKAERDRLKSLFLSRASEFGIKPLVQEALTEAKTERKATIANILDIMRNDPFYADVRYNSVLNSAEIDGGRRWSDADASASRSYLEEKYGIYNKNKHRDALNLLFREREYNPILDIIASVKWDGRRRCENFLCKWALAENTPYVREVSRLIFGGGINRLLLPGCKFDDVPVLVSREQGTGKSTMCRFLAMHDDYFGEVRTIDGSQSIEALSGKWIMEIPELAAFTKVKEVEAVKAFITRQRDSYRKPYAEAIEDRLRRCIFIGTTNNPRFLSDVSGNRRFFPVTVRSNGYDIFEHEAEIRSYILQCWAEALERYKAGTMPPFADRSLVGEYVDAQENAMQDDWRVGAIEEYLSQKAPGDFVCVKEIMVMLNNGVDRSDISPRESKEINIILSKFTDWELSQKRQYTKWGQQRGFIKRGVKK